MAGKHARRTGLTVIAVVLVIGSYFLMMAVLDRSPWLNFEVVHEGRLLRSGQAQEADLEWMHEEYGLETIINLRGKSDGHQNIFAHNNNIRMVVLDMSADDPPTPRQMEFFFSIMRGDTIDMREYEDILEKTTAVQKKKVKFELPVLIHCQGGSDRTGVMVALYRMAFQGWDLEEAKNEMMSHWHIPFAHPRQFEFLEEMSEKIESENLSVHHKPIKVSSASDR